MAIYENPILTGSTFVSGTLGITGFNDVSESLASLSSDIANIPTVPDYSSGTISVNSTIAGTNNQVTEKAGWSTTSNEIPFEIAPTNGDKFRIAAEDMDLSGGNVNQWIQVSTSSLSAGDAFTIMVDHINTNTDNGQINLFLAVLPATGSNVVLDDGYGVIGPFPAARVYSSNNSSYNDGRDQGTAYTLVETRVVALPDGDLAVISPSNAEEITFASIWTP